MTLKIALAGNPNSGKTTMFNELTGSMQYVGNRPGVTVEKKEGKLKGSAEPEIIIQDLPGIYSLSPYSPEEIVTRRYLLLEKPDAIINVVDTSNLERNLYLTTQLIELNIPIVIALNMIDIVKKNGVKINLDELGNAFGCAAVETSALKNTGANAAVAKASEAARTGEVTNTRIFTGELADSLEKIKSIINGIIPGENLDFYAVKLFERDPKILDEYTITTDIRDQIEKIISECEKRFGDDSESLIANARYEYIEGIVKRVIKKSSHDGKTMRPPISDRIDRVVTNRVLAFPIFAAVMFAVYFLAVSVVGGILTNWVSGFLFGDWIPGLARLILGKIGSTGPVNSLVLNGIIGGIGSVLGFLPQLLVLFFCLALLEDCGYMARIAFILDRVFRKFGLSGKSFIPILIGTGCSVPGIMASRTIENENDRRMTIITTTFIPCGAKLPIIALISGAFFPGSAWVAPSAYFIGISAILLTGLLLKNTRPFSGESTPFIMEMPSYHLPVIKNALFHTWDKGKSFIKKAGTVILLASVIIWFLSNFGWNMNQAKPAESILASLGHFIAPLFSPLGWGKWELAVATISGLAAKENIVSSLGVLYGYSGGGMEFWPSLAASFSAPAAYSFLVFNLLCAPCIAAVSAIAKEMSSIKWTLFAIGYQTVFAYAASFLVFHMFSFFAVGASASAGSFAVLALVLAACAAALRSIIKRRKNGCCGNCAECAGYTGCAEYSKKHPSKKTR